MNFEEILANCLDALERGETIESCLARYPKQATELAPLLHLATTVRSAPQPRLSAQAFQRGREAVRAQAHYQHSLRSPFDAAAFKTAQKPTPARAQPVLSKPRPHQPPLLKPFVFMQRTTGVFVSLVLLLCLLTLMRNIITSLPGAILYPVKILSENMEGLLLTAAGEQVTWRAQQTENRLQELVILTQQEQTATTALVNKIDANVQATLAASNKLPPAQRNQFLSAWVERLQTIQKDKSLPATVIFTLDKAIATVQSATQVTIAPVTSPTETAPAEATSTAPPTSVFTPILVPTRIPIAVTPLLVQQAPPQVTVNTTEPASSEATPTPALPTYPTAEPVVIAPTPTTALVVIQVPRENPPSDEEHHSDRHRAAAQASPTPTNEPVVAAATQPANSVAVDNHSARASNVMTTSVDTASSATTHKSSDDAGKTPEEGTATAALAAPPDILGTANVTAIASPQRSDTPAPTTVTTSQPSTPTEVKSTATPMQTPEATALATSSTKHSSPTPTPKKTATPEPEKTVEPTDEPTDTPQPAAPTATSADDEQIEDTPTSQPDPAATSSSSGGNHKQPGKK